MSRKVFGLAAGMGLAALAFCAAAPAVARPRPTLKCEAVQSPGPGVYVVAPQPCDASAMIVAVREEGELRPPYDAPADGPAQTAYDLIAPVLRELDRRAIEAAAPCAPGVEADSCGVLRILVFAHGGMVTFDGGVEGAQAKAGPMLADGYAPVFLVWDAGLLPSYRQRLCCLQDGESDKHDAAFAIPSRLAGDLGSSLARSPQYFGGQVRRFNDSVLRTSGTKYYLKTAEQERVEACDGLSSCPTIVMPDLPTIAALNDQPVRPSFKQVRYASLIGFRALATLVLPEVGAAAWDNMVRRTRMALQRPADEIGCDVSSQANRGKDRKGGFAILFDRLACKITETGDGGFDWETEGCNDTGFRMASRAAQTAPEGCRRIHLPRLEMHFYGHSMGSLVGNEVLWRRPDLPWTKVVYMAAASTFRDFRLSALPVLAHRQARFYNLMLHPLNESRELFAGGVLPQGSLLEWIDEMFEGPRSPDERVMGKWENMKKDLALVPADARRLMSLRVFPKQEDPDPARGEGVLLADCVTPLGAAAPPRCYPTMHGDFSHYSFWRDAFLTGSAAGAQAAPVR